MRCGDGGGLAEGSQGRLAGAVPQGPAHLGARDLGVCGHGQSHARPSAAAQGALSPAPRRCPCALGRADGPRLAQDPAGLGRLRRALSKKKPRRKAGLGVRNDPGVCPRFDSGWSSSLLTPQNYPA